MINVFILSLTLASHAPHSPIDRLAWLAGCWRRTSGDRVIDEHWMAARGGMMLGIGRTTQGGKVVEYESMRIFERAGSLVFAAQPSGQPADEFVAAKIAGQQVTFENAKHDFPQRVIYGAGAGDSLFARIEGIMKGVPRGMDFHLARVVCEGAPRRQRSP